MSTRIKTLKVTGQQTMHCGGCENTVAFTLKQLPGVEQVKASYKTQHIHIVFDPHQLDLNRIRQELAWIGYQVEAAEAGESAT